MLWSNFMSTPMAKKNRTKFSWIQSKKEWIYMKLTTIQCLIPYSWLAMEQICTPLSGNIKMTTIGDRPSCQPCCLFYLNHVNLMVSTAETALQNSNWEKYIFWLVKCQTILKNLMYMDSDLFEQTFVFSWMGSVLVNC